MWYYYSYSVSAENFQTVESDEIDTHQPNRNVLPIDLLMQLQLNQEKTIPVIGHEAIVRE